VAQSAPATSHGQGTNWGLVLAIVAGALVLVAVAVVLVRRARGRRTAGSGPP
jgi:uncharacterized membrane protein (UPF0136 family)